MNAKLDASPYLFRNKKPTLISRSRSFDIKSPITDGLALINVEADGKFRLISANDTFLRNINIAEKRPIGLYISNIFWGDNFEDEKLHINIQKACDNEEAIAFIWQLVNGGYTHTVLCKVIPLLGVDGNITHINVITSDYEDTERLEIEIKQHNYFDPLNGLTKPF